MGKAKLFAICTPTLGLISPHWANQYYQLAFPMNCSHLRMYKVGLPVAEARNACVQEALEQAEAHKEDTELSHIFWVDDDVIIHPAALLQLLSRQTPIVSGVYFGKDDYGEPLIFHGIGCGAAKFHPDVYEPVWGHGMGLTLIEAEVYRRMRDELDLGLDSLGHPKWYYTHDKTPVGLQNGIPSQLSMTEDFYFLDAAHRLGYQPMIDQTARAFGFHHNKKTREGYPKKQWEEFTSKGTISWDGPDGPVTWTDWR